MPVVPQYVIDDMRNYPYRLPLEPRHGWRSSPDERGHGHCKSCGITIYPGDPVVARYLEYVSISFCMACVADNPELFAQWIARGPQ